LIHISTGEVTTPPADECTPEVVLSRRRASQSALGEVRGLRRQRENVPKLGKFLIKPHYILPHDVECLIREARFESLTKRKAANERAYVE
jgi:hypothetical protein